MNVPLALCLLKLCNGKAWLCGAGGKQERRGAYAEPEQRVPRGGWQGLAVGIGRQSTVPGGARRGRTPVLLGKSKWSSSLGRLD